MTNKEIITGLFVAAMYFWYTGERRLAKELIDTALVYKTSSDVWTWQHAIFEPNIFAEMALTDRKVGNKLS